MNNEFLIFPDQMNFELTTQCPLNCPQCYCDLNHGVRLDYGRAVQVLRDGAAKGLRMVNLSGGETMLYPQLFDLIAESVSCGVFSNVALSGWGIDKSSLRSLIDSGVSRIFVSLNGASSEINALSRNGYDLALNTLRLLKELQFSNVSVNFVVHSNNCDDFLNMVRLCEEYKVNQLMVMSVKPTSAKEMKTVPSFEQSMRLAENVRTAQLCSKVKIDVEHCYSQLRAFLGRSWLFGNTNTGITKGCIAGRALISLNVHGNFTPCRHLDMPESFDSVSDYWTHSKELATLRKFTTASGGVCKHCKLNAYCLPCFASRIIRENCNFYCS